MWYLVLCACSVFHVTGLLKVVDANCSLPRIYYGYNDLLSFGISSYLLLLIFQAFPTTEQLSKKPSFGAAQIWCLNMQLVGRGHHQGVSYMTLVFKHFQVDQ